MRAILSGQVGLDKKAYVERVVKFAATSDHRVSLFHVGDRMYDETPEIRGGRILDLPISRLHSVRRSVFKDIISESRDCKDLIVNTHATFRWRHGLFRAFDFDQMESLKPDMFICLVDNIDAVHHRLHVEHSVDATLKDMMVWREEEILAMQLLALALKCQNQCYVLPRGRDTETIETCFRLVCNPDQRKAYLSFPMSHVYDLPDIMAEIREFREEFSKHFVVFDPADVDEKLLLEAAIEATKKGEDFVTSRALDADGQMIEYPVSVKQILEIASDIDGQIYARDFQMVDQSDMIISLVPELTGGVPGLSSGVERELHHAYEHGKEVYVIWKPARPPSPFITETATHVFRTTDEALAFFREGDASERRAGKAKNTSPA
jgi:adenylate kinase